MDIHFAAPDLTSLDQLKSEVLCLPLFSDERPLRGAPGLVDWRLCGRVSELLALQRMTGAAGEAVLMPARPRLALERLLWLGLGPAASFGEDVFRAFVVDAMERLMGLRVRSASLVLPGRPCEQVLAERAIEWFLEAAAPFGDQLDELTVLEAADAERAMTPLVERARRRALAGLA